MAQEKFGPVGNERYRQYLLDILGSGQHLLALVNDLLDLSKIEAGRLDLDFAQVALNPLTQQCVALLAPQANRERIIIRTSLSPKLPPVQRRRARAAADRAQPDRLLGQAHRRRRAGDRIDDAHRPGRGGVAGARQRHRHERAGDRPCARAVPAGRRHGAQWRGRQRLGRHRLCRRGVGLPLAKALAEANRATFSIKSAPHAGTLIEVAFPPG